MATRTPITVSQKLDGHEIYAVAHWIPREEVWTVMGKIDGEVAYAGQTDKPWDEVKTFFDEALTDITSQPREA